MSYYDWNNLHQDQSTVLDKDNHNSVIGRYGGIGQHYTDPLAWLLGDKYQKLTSETIPNMLNKGYSQFMKPLSVVDKKLNPLRKIPFINNGMTAIENKPADALATAAGAIFGGQALGSMMGGGGGGSSAGTPVAQGHGASTMLGQNGLGQSNTGFLNGMSKEQMLAKLLQTGGNQFNQAAQNPPGQQYAQQPYQAPSVPVSSFQQYRG